VSSWKKSLAWWLALVAIAAVSAGVVGAIFALTR
jgi:hypothetical protein